MEQQSSAVAQPIALREAAAVRSPWLLGPWLDPALIGGASLVMFALSYVIVDKSASTNQISWTAYYLAMLINNPHFMASYHFLYWDKRHELLSNRRFFWAAIVVPLLLVAYFAYGIMNRSPTLLSYAVNLMYFTVGWHYIKQIYGTIIVTSARRGYFFTPGEARALKLNLYPVWFMSFINGNEGIRTVMHYGIGYQTFDVPSWAQTVNYGLVAVSLVGLGVVLFRKWARDGQLPGRAAICSFAAIYVWYLPTLYHPHFWYVIPFFHSLQYMLFVFTMKRNEARALAASEGQDPQTQRLQFANNYFGFLALILVLAALTFKIIPEALDARVAYDHKVFGSELFMFLFITFINIHHYFIDNVIWRRDNPALKKYLMG